MAFLKEKQDIVDWLSEHHVENYDLVADEQHGYMVNVQGDVDLYTKQLTHIPVKFNQVSGAFYCNNNQLTSLEFCPQQVGGSFYCSNNKLISLEFCPQRVDGSFYCSENQLTSLKFCPQHVGGDFYCYHNQLTSLEFAPQQVSGNFYCQYNQLTTLEFCPQHVGGGFYCTNNQALKNIQSITDFKAIYQLHREAVIAKNYMQLTQSLAVVDPVSLQNNSLKAKL